MTADRFDDQVLPGRRSFFAAFFGRTVTVALLIGAAIGLTNLATQSPRPGADGEYYGPPGSGITVRDEVADIWMPEALLEFTRRLSENPISHSIEALPSHMKREGCENLWYALTRHFYQVNGRFTKLTTIEYPGQSAGDSQRFLDIVDALRAETARPVPSRPPSARFHIIPPELLKLAPQLAVSELLK